jgi:hypothetical protein
MKNTRIFAFGRSFYIFVAFLALIGLGGSSVKAQTPLARFVLPTNTTATAVNPTFKIITSLRIDTTSVHWNFEWIDSTHFVLPVLCVIPHGLFSGLGDTVWQTSSMRGTGTVINDTTIEFTSNTLSNGYECEAILMGLRVISGADTITIPDTVARLTFTTIGLPPDLVDVNIIDSGLIVREYDTITARFTNKFDSANSASGAILSLVIPKPIYDSLDTSYVVSDSLISASTWLDPADSSEIHILPSLPFVPGQNYRVNITLGGLTGDTDQNSGWGFMCKKSYRLNIVAAPTGGLTCLDTVHFNPPINEHYKMQYDSSFDSISMTELYDTSVVYDSNFVGTIVNAGDTVYYIAPTQVGGAIFKQWSGTGITVIDTSTNPVLTISETSNQLNDITAVALYARVPVDTLCVATAGANTIAGNSDFVQITSDSLDCPLTTLNDTCASTSSVNYSMEQGKMITLSAFTTSDSVKFGYWSSADTNINGQTNPTISIQASGNVCATAVFGCCGGGGGGTGPYTIIVQVYDETPGVNTYVSTSGGVAWVSGASSVGNCTSTTWCSVDLAQTLHTLTLHLSNPAYAVEKFKITGPSPTTAGTSNPSSVGLPFSGTPYTYTIPYGTPLTGYKTYSTYPTYTYVTFYIKKIYETITILETLADGNTPSPLPMLITPSTTATPSGMWVKVNHNPKSIISQGEYTADPWYPNCYRWELLYDPATATSLNITAGESSKTPYWFQKWNPHPFSPNTNPTSPSTDSVLTGVSLSQIPQPYVTAVFLEPFMLTNIIFYYIDANGNLQQWSDVPSNWPPKLEPSGYLPATNVTSWFSASIPQHWDYYHPVGIQLTFNQQLSMYSYSNPSGGQLTSTEGDKGEVAFDITTQNERTYAISYSAYVGNSIPPTENSLANACLLNNSRTIWFGLSTNDGTDAFYGYIWKGQKFSLDISQIRSISGQKPSNNLTTFDFQTVAPNVQWRYSNTYVDNSHDNPFTDSWSWTEWGAAGWIGSTANKKDTGMSCLESISDGTNCNGNLALWDPGESTYECITDDSPPGIPMIEEDRCGSSQRIMAGAMNGLFNTLFGNTAGNTCVFCGVGYSSIQNIYNEDYENRPQFYEYMPIGSNIGDLLFFDLGYNFSTNLSDPNLDYGWVNGIVSFPPIPSSFNTPRGLGREHWWGADNFSRNNYWSEWGSNQGQSAGTQLLMSDHTSRYDILVSIW